MAPDSRKGPADETDPSKPALTTIPIVTHGSDQTALVLEGVPDIDTSINPAWSMEAAQVLQQLALTEQIITADVLHDVPGLGRPAHGNMVGPVFAAAHKRGLIEKLGYCASRRSGRNGSALAVWRGVRR